MLLYLGLYLISFPAIANSESPGVASCQQQNLEFEIQNTAFRQFHNEILREHEKLSQQNRNILNTVLEDLDHKSELNFFSRRNESFLTLMNHYSKHFRERYSEDMDDDEREAGYPTHALEKLFSGIAASMEKALDSKYGIFPGRSEGKSRCKDVRDRSLLPYVISEDRDLAGLNITSSHMLLECVTQPGEPSKILRYVPYAPFSESGVIEVLNTNRYGTFEDRKPEQSFFGRQFRILTESGAGKQLGLGILNRVFTSPQYQRLFYRLRDSNDHSIYNTGSFRDLSWETNPFAPQQESSDDSLNTFAEQFRPRCNQQRCP